MGDRTKDPSLWLTSGSDEKDERDLAEYFYEHLDMPLVTLSSGKVTLGTKRYCYDGNRMSPNDEEQDLIYYNRKPVRQGKIGDDTW